VTAVARFAGLRVSYTLSWGFTPGFMLIPASQVKNICFAGFMLIPASQVKTSASQANQNENFSW
jgi:hypothetical protein